MATVSDQAAPVQELQSQISSFDQDRGKRLQGRSVQAGQGQVWAGGKPSRASRSGSLPPPRLQLNWRLLRGSVARWASSCRLPRPLWKVLLHAGLGERDQHC